MPESPPMSPTSPKVGVSQATTALQLQQFLDDWHYRIIHSSLGKKWPRSKVVTCVLDILAFNGVPINEDQRKTFPYLEENAMVDQLAALVPQNVREGFEHLALQLQMVVTMATRARKALEDKDVEEVKDIMEKADETGLGQQVLKAAIVSASKEVAEILKCQETWIGNMKDRLERLLSASEYAEKANQDLLKVESQLQDFGVDSKGKSKKVLMGMADKNEKALKSSVLSAWTGAARQIKEEFEIRSRFENELKEKQATLFEMKKRRFRNIQGVMASSQADGEAGILKFTLKCWFEEVVRAKQEGDTAKALKELEEKLKNAKNGQSEKSKQVLARMSGNKDGMLVNLAFQAWTGALAEIKKEKEFEEAVAKSEKLLKDYAAKQKDQASSVLTRMSNASDTGLKATMFKAWGDALAERKKEEEMSKALGGKAGGLAGLKSRMLGNARGVQGRVNEQMNMNLLLKCIGAWQIEAKLQHVDRYYSGKVDSKRRQLNSVQTLFKSFARQLEEGLGNLDGDSSGRTRKSDRNMKGSASLPDIHHKPHVA